MRRLACELPLPLQRHVQAVEEAVEAAGEVLQLVPRPRTGEPTVVEGHGTSRIGDQTLSWGPKDVFSIPHGNWVTHFAEGVPARLFVVTDRDVLRRLDLLKEEFGNAARR